MAIAVAAAGAVQGLREQARPRIVELDDHHRRDHQAQLAEQAQAVVAGDHLEAVRLPRLRSRDQVLDHSELADRAADLLK